MIHPTLEKIKTLKWYGMAKAWEDPARMPDLQELSFEDRLGLLIDRESTDRENRRLQLRLRQARLRQSACLEEVDGRSRRGLDKALLATLASCEWIRSHLHGIATGPTGCGKTYLACALGQKACREGYRVEYQRLPRLLPDLGLAKGDGRYASILRRLAKLDWLIWDDWGLYPMTPENRRDRLELVEDRSGRRSTLLTSQLPLDHWHDSIGDPTLADAILDRLVHDAYKITLKGESMRKLKSQLQETHEAEKVLEAWDPEIKKKGIERNAFPGGTPVGLRPPSVPPGFLPDRFRVSYGTPVVLSERVAGILRNSRPLSLGTPGRNHRNRQDSIICGIGTKAINPRVRLLQGFLSYPHQTAKNHYLFRC